MDPQNYQLRMDEESYFSQTQELMKNFIFGFLYILQKESKINPYFLGVLNLIQYLQLHSYMFRSEISDVWKNKSIADGMNTFLSHLLFETYFTTLNAYVIFLFIQMGLFFFMILVIGYMAQQYYAHSFINRAAASIMRIVLQLFVTILFMPVMNYHAKAWKCTIDEQGKSVFFSIDCFNAEHVGYCIVSLINLILYLLIAMTVVVTYFECRFRAEDLTSKINARSDAIMLTYIIVQEIAFSIMHDQSFLYILLVITLGGSLIIFLAFAFNSQYHDFKFSRYHATLSSILMWSAFMLAVATAMEGNLIGGTIVAWIVGVPFVICIVLTQKDRQLESLVLNINKLNNPEEIMSQTRYILTLLRLQSASKYAVILDGYIEVHRQVCDKLECPLKKYKPGQNKRLINTIKQNNVEVKNDKQALLILTLYQMLDRGLEKFEKNVDLRIQYAFFLLEIMSYKHKALQELQKAELCEPSFDTQFIIYKYKRVIESEIQEDQNEKIVSNHEILPISAAPPIISGLALQIEKAAYLHMEYWSELNDDTPDIAKLEGCGKKVTESIRNVQLLWNKLKRVCPNHQQSIMLYSAFLIEVLNDREYGQSLNETLRKMIQGYNNSKIEDIDNHDFSNDPTPTIILTSDNEKFGVIQQLNQAGAALFNYTKSELINQNIQMLMPDMIGKSHDRFVEDFINNSDYKYQSKDRPVICRNKSGYLFQMTLNIKPINSVKSGISFLGTFYQDKFQKQSTFILVNQKGQIEGISNGCLPLLRIDLRIVRIRKNLQDYFPGLFENREQYFNKAGNQLIYNIPKDIQRNLDKQSVKLKEEDKLFEQIEYSITLMCFGNEIQFSYANFPAGYCFRFEKPANLNVSGINTSLVSKKSNPHNFLVDRSKQQNINKFIFVYNEAEKTIEGFFKELPSYSDIGSRLDESVINVNRSIATPNLDSMSQKNQQSDSEQKYDFSDGTPQNKKIRLDDGIRTVRLFQNKIGEIVNDDQQIMEEEEQEYEGNQYLGVNQNLLYDDSEEAKQQDQDAFQSRSKLEQAIDQSVMPFPIKFLRLAEFILTISMIALAFVDYFLDINQLQDIQLTLDIFNAQTDILSEWQYLTEDIRDIQSIQLQSLTQEQIIVKYDTIKQSMLYSINVIQDKLNTIILSGYTMPTELSNLYQQPSINMSFNSSTTITQDFQEASSQMLSYAITIANSDFNAIRFNSIDLAIYFIIQNGYNAYYEALLKTSEIVLSDFTSKTADKSSNFVIIVVVAAVVLSLSFAIIVIILLSVQLSKEFVIIMFFELPNKITKSLYNKCEMFVKYINAIDGDGSEKDEDFEHNEDQDDMLQQDSKKKKKKKFKNTTKPPVVFYIQIFILAAFLEAYFIMSLVLQKNNLGDVRQTVYEANSTILAEQFYALSSNVQQQEYIDSTQLIQGIDAQQQTLNNLYKMYQLDSLIHKQHSQNIDKHSTLYLDSFNTIMFLNPCERLNSIDNTIIIADCEVFAEGSVKNGFTVALTRFFENIRYLQTIFYQIENGQITLEQLGISEIVIYDLPLKNQEINLLQLDKIQEIKTMQRTYFRIGIRYLGNQFIEGMIVNQNNYSNQKIGLFITYLVVIVLIYFFYWIPFHRHLMQEIWKTRMTLLMIPVENVRRLKNAKSYLKSLINKKT